jgi:aminoglycoside phosphotransferase (APT) family kinase protein
VTLRRHGAASATLDELLRSTFGPRCKIDGIRAVHEEGDYRVLRVELRDPDRAVVVKLCAPDDPRAAGFARAAAIAPLVRTQTGVPTYDVCAVDTSGSRWPWAYLIMGAIAGTGWREVVPSLELRERQQVYEQLGRAVAGLHAIRFDTYGEIGSERFAGRARGAEAPAHSNSSGLKSVTEPTYSSIAVSNQTLDNATVDAQGYLEALAAWAATLIADPQHLALFQRLLREHADRFADVGPPRLTHEDLNPTNLLLRRDPDGWRLAGVLDFDKAWAGCGESDLARLELWEGMTDPGFWEGYTSVLPVPDGYPARRPLYQLLWCLEYARATPQHNTDTRAVCDELGIAPVIFA